MKWRKKIYTFNMLETAERNASGGTCWMVIVKSSILRTNFKGVSGMVSRCNVINANFLKILNLFSLYTGCPECYKDRETVNPVNGKTMEQLFEDTRVKVEYLEKQGFEVKQKWECELVKEMEHDEDMKRYFEEYELVDPLQPRDAFYGGRTNAAKLLHECQGDEKIK